MSSVAFAGESKALDVMYLPLMKMVFNDRSIAKTPTLEQLKFGRSWSCVEADARAGKKTVLRVKNRFIFSKDGDKIINSSNRHVVTEYTAHDAGLIGTAYGHVSAIRATGDGQILEQWMNPETGEILSYSFCEAR